MLKRLNDIARKVLRMEKSRGQICITLADDEMIRSLNKVYRRMDRATDVLSFEMGEDGMLGDIVISVDSALRNAKRYGVTMDEEMKRLVIHGTLHLLGHDHKKRSERDVMSGKEELYAKKIR
jgi:probable rRNA maturation factor